MKKLFSLCALSLILGFSGLAKADFPWGLNQADVTKKHPGGKTKCKDEDCDYTSFQKNKDLKEGVYVTYLFKNDSLQSVMFIFTTPEDKGNGFEDLKFLSKQQTTEVLVYLTKTLTKSFGEPKMGKRKDDLMLYWENDASLILILEVCDKVGQTVLPNCQPLAIFKSKLNPI